MIIDHNMKFDHLGVVVSDLDKGRRHFSELYGINDWTDQFRDELNGVLVQFGTSGGNICYELVSPISKSSPVYNVLTKKINILNHFAYLVDNIRISSDVIIKKGFVALGLKKSAVAYDMNKIQFFYSREFNYILELIEAKDHIHNFKSK